MRARSSACGGEPSGRHRFGTDGERGDLVKLLWHDGVGMSLYIKRLEAGKFIWPAGSTGAAVAISAAQLGYLPEGMDWRNPRWTAAPGKGGVNGTNCLFLLALISLHGRSSPCHTNGPFN